MFHANVTGLDPNDPAKAAAVMEANSRAVKHSNDAVVAMKRGRYEEAVALHQQALALKLPAFGSNSVQAAISYNGLGECLLKAGRVADAEVNLAKALHVRDSKSSGGLGLGPPMDSAVTRDNMAQVYEAQGKWDEAKEMRLRGSEKGEMVCGNYECPGYMFPLDQLKACSACKSVYYHDVACQKADWGRRHKKLCQARVKPAAKQ